MGGSYEALPKVRQPIGEAAGEKVACLNLRGGPDSHLYQQRQKRETGGTYQSVWVCSSRSPGLSPAGMWPTNPSSSALCSLPRQAVYVRPVWFSSEMIQLTHIWAKHALQIHSALRGSIETGGKTRRNKLPVEV